MERLDDLTAAESAESRANKLVDGPKAEAFARALDTLGWMIVQQPQNADGIPIKWPMDPKYGPVPKWADGCEKFAQAEAHKALKKTLQLIDGGKKVT